MLLSILKDFFGLLLSIITFYIGGESLNIPVKIAIGLICCIFVTSIIYTYFENKKNFINEQKINEIKKNVETTKNKVDESNAAAKETKNYIESVIDRIEFENTLQFKAEKAKASKRVVSYVKAILRLNNINENLPEYDNEIPHLYLPLTSSLYDRIETNSEGHAVARVLPSDNNPTKAEKILKEAIELDNNGEIGLAITILDKLPNIEEFSRACATAGLLYIKGGKTERGLKLLSRAEEIDPSDPYITNIIASSYGFLNDQGTAALFYEKTLELSADHLQDENISNYYYISLINLITIYDQFHIIKNTFELANLFLKNYPEKDEKYEYIQSLIKKE